MLDEFKNKSEPARHEEIGNMLEGIRRRELEAAKIFIALGQEVRREVEKSIGGALGDDMDTRGLYSAEGSISLIGSNDNGLVRTAAFLEAIHDAPSPDKVIDAGCGALCLLGLAATTFHGSRVEAVELNPFSVAVAQRFVELAGYKDAIHFQTGDATTCTFPEADFDCLMTETFYFGLLEEPGIQIIKNLNRYLKPGGSTVPSKVAVSTTINMTFGREERGERQLLTTLDLAKITDDIITGTTVHTIPSSGGPDLYINAQADFIGPRDQAMLTRDRDREREKFTTLLTSPRRLRNFRTYDFLDRDEENARIRVRVKYKAGTINGDRENIKVSVERI